MPRIYSRRSRTTAQLRDQLLRELEKEGEKLLKQLTNEFTASLNNEAQRSLQNLLPNVSAGGRAANSGSEGLPFGADSLTRLFTTGARLLLSRPRTSRSTQETSRSTAMERAFRLSRSQAAAEAGFSLGRGDRNS